MTMNGTLVAVTYKRTPEHQAKITAALRGRKLSPAAIAKREASRRANGNRVKHGHGVGGDRTPTYTSWDNMVQRCTNPLRREYRWYGGRGISVCDRWRSFVAFLADMGPRPEGKTLDRIDNDRGYEPGNCRWATKAEQMANRRRSSYYDRPSRIPECGHPDRPHKARGLCQSCWQAERRRADPERARQKDKVANDRRAARRRDRLGSTS